jgi:hypothetical protein
MRRTKWLEASFRYEIRKLTRNIENLREVIYKVEVQRSGLVIFGLFQLICTVIVFWKQATHTCCCKRTDASSNATDAKPSSNQNSTSNSQQQEFVFRKRSNSEQYLKKVSKKKRRKELLRGNEEVFTFKSPSPIIQPTSNGWGPVRSSANALPLLPKSSQSNGSTTNTDRIYPLVNTSSMHTNVGGIKQASTSTEGPQNCQRTNAYNVSDSGAGSSSKSGSATSLDKINKASKSKSSKSFAFWK